MYSGDIKIKDLTPSISIYFCSKMSMKNIPPEIYKQIQDAMCRPEGTVTFKYTFKDLFNPDIGSGIILEIPSGAHLFRLERDANLLLHFYHSSPGTGTRVASIDLKQVVPADSVFFAFTWSPKEINLHVGPQVEGGKLLSARGNNSKKKFRVGKDGGVYQIGNEGVEVMGINVYKGGQPVLQPTAIEAWKETIKAIEILATGKSDQGYVFETTVTNLTLVILVTGFEAYSKKRFLELEKEGITSETESIVSFFFPKKEREAGILDLLKIEAKEAHKSVLELIVDRGVINFQNYDKCKLAFNKAYDIKFGELGVASSDIEKLKKFIKYRHRIIHVSALIGMLNQSESPPEEPVFPKKELANEATKTFDMLITKIHETTLKLKRND